ncbi:hypothetical protein QVD17_00071 [Tagetes erecta]|uniref:Uncharacterized protein n=1 Tax=Tagetes erecta TaxID=13708 RepID=A0AAD8L775_TARER|nr:hypothetical protein QVD17_00071 [Tagetes erecta]
MAMDESGELRPMGGDLASKVKNIDGNPICGILKKHAKPQGSMSANVISDSKQQQSSDVSAGDIVPETFKSIRVSGIEGNKDDMSAGEIHNSSLNGTSYLGAVQSAKKGGHG